MHSMPHKWSVIETNRQFETLNTNMPKKSDLHWVGFSSRLWLPTEKWSQLTNEINSIRWYFVTTWPTFHRNGTDANIACQTGWPRPWRHISHFDLFVQIPAIPRRKFSETVIVIKIVKDPIKTNIPIHTAIMPKFSPNRSVQGCSFGSSWWPRMPRRKLKFLLVYTSLIAWSTSSKFSYGIAHKQRQTVKELSK